MLNQDSVDSINNRIQQLVESLDSIFTTDTKRPMILAEIARLNTVLNPQPIIEIDPSEIAEAIVAKVERASEPNDSLIRIVVDALLTR